MAAGDTPVTMDRMQQALLGVTTQLQASIQEAKSEAIGLITEAELRWQAKLDEQLSTPLATAAVSELRAQVAADKSALEATLAAQNGEMTQIQQSLTELETQARRSENAAAEATALLASTTTQLVQKTEDLLTTRLDHMTTRLDDRTDRVLDVMSEQVEKSGSEIREEVQTIVGKMQWRSKWLSDENWRLSGEVWQLQQNAQNHPQSSFGGGGPKKVRVKIPERAGLEIFAGETEKDKEGFIAWRDKLELHLDTVWPGLGDVFEKIRDAKEPIDELEFNRLVGLYGDMPHDTEPEDWTMKPVGRHLYKVLVDHTTLEAKKTIDGAPNVHTVLSVQS